MTSAPAVVTNLPKSRVRLVTGAIVAYACWAMNASDWGVLPGVSGK